MTDKLFINAAVVTVDPEHRVFFPGYVAVSGSRIEAAGPMEELPEELRAAVDHAAGTSACGASRGAGAIPAKSGGSAPGLPEIIDCSGKALLPGLVDAHGHSGHATLRYLGESAWNWDFMAAELYCMDTDDFFWYADSAVTAAERLKFGITTGVSMLGSLNRPDRPELLSAHFEGSSKTGIREFSGLGFSGNSPKLFRHFEPDGSFREYRFDRRDTVKNAERAIRENQGRYPRSFCMVSPSVMGRKAGLSDAESAAENLAMHRLAEKYGTIVHTHAYAGDVKFMSETTPEVLGPKLSLTHSTGISAEEIRIIAETGTWVFHGPSTHSIIWTPCPVFDLLRAGANVAIVTDGAAPDRGYDIWRDMKTFRSIHRISEKDFQLAPPGLILELCTIRPAKALGLGDELGSIEPGKLADLITVDLMQPHFAPLRKDQLVQAIVYAACGTDVRDVWVEGEPVMRDRKLLKCSEAQIISDVNESFERMASRAGEERMNLFMSNDSLYGLRGSSRIDKASAFEGLEFELKQPEDM
jgi:cytosine/adenosine deaminase-related metal-dependent hydrolase